MARLLLGLAAALVALAADVSAQAFLLRPGDRITVNVLEDPALDRTVLVRPDGRITFPLAGTVQAGGRTPEQVQSEIRGRLSRDFVEPPTVTVSLAGLGEESLAALDDRRISVYVLGQVGQPGVYELEAPVDALQALAIAGGPGVFAATRRIQVRRRGDEREMVLLLDYDSIESGEAPSSMIPLADGDVIVVPERGLFE